jgi:hypothetical protein
MGVPTQPFAGDRLETETLTGAPTLYVLLAMAPVIRIFPDEYGYTVTV